VRAISGAVHSVSQRSRARRCVITITSITNRPIDGLALRDECSKKECPPFFMIDGCSIGIPSPKRPKSAARLVERAGLQVRDRHVSTITWQDVKICVTAGGKLSMTRGSYRGNTVATGVLLKNVKVCIWQRSSARPGQPSSIVTSVQFPRSDCSLISMPQVLSLVGDCNPH